MGCSWAYDQFGNRWQQNAYNGGSCTTPQLSFSSANNRAAQFGYDAAGDVTNDTSYCYLYDAEGRISNVYGLNCSTLVASYVYDAEGRRVRKAISGGSTVDYLYDLAGHQIDEVSSTGTWNRGEIYAGSRHLATYDNGTSGTTYFNHEDWLGTERVRTNVSATVCEIITSGVWGDMQNASGPCADSSPMHFTGKMRDIESNLDDFDARYYSSQWGRFMIPDPLMNSGQPNDPQSWNRYSYVRNNPSSSVDPTGLYDLNNTCESSDKKCNAGFRHNADRLKNGLKSLQDQLKNVRDPVQKARLEKALKAMGTEGDHNGVTVSFGATKLGGAGEKDPVNDPTTFKETYNVTLDPKMLKNDNDYAIAGAHEGTHIDDINSELADPSLGVLSDFSLEYRGYQTSIFAASALGAPSLSAAIGGKSYDLWNGSWAQVDANITNLVTKFRDQNGRPNHPETIPHNPWNN